LKVETERKQAEEMAFARQERIKQFNKDYRQVFCSLEKKSKGFILLTLTYVGKAFFCNVQNRKLKNYVPKRDGK